jgi:hypothetical protein
VEDDVDAFHRPHEAIPIADIPDQEADVGQVPVALALVELLGLVASEDPDDPGIQRDQPLDQPSADRSGSSRDEDSPTLDAGDVADLGPPCA